jgi:hypothetical protein
LEKKHKLFGTNTWPHEHGPIPRYDTDGKFHKSTIYHRFCCRFVSIVPSKFTIREPRVMAVRVPFKRMSNGTSGTIGKIGLRIVNSQ